MDVRAYNNKLRNVTAEFLNEFLQECYKKPYASEEKDWLSLKLAQIVTLNLMSVTEINELFGRTSNRRLDEGTRGTAQLRIFALVGAISSKYGLFPTVSVGVPVKPAASSGEESAAVVAITETPSDVATVPPLVDVTKLKLNERLDEYCWYKELTVRAKSGLLHKKIYTLGSLLISDPKLLIKQPNFGARSLGEIIDTLRKQGLKMGMITEEHFAAYVQEADKAGAD